jgi:hypothetical protein
MSNKSSLHSNQRLVGVEGGDSNILTSCLLQVTSHQLSLSTVTQMLYFYRCTHGRRPTLLGNIFDYSHIPHMRITYIPVFEDHMYTILLFTCLRCVNSHKIGSTTSMARCEFISRWLVSFHWREGVIYWAFNTRVCGTNLVRIEATSMANHKYDLYYPQTRNWLIEVFPESTCPFPHVHQ